MVSSHYKIVSDKNICTSVFSRFSKYRFLSVISKWYYLFQAFIRMKIFLEYERVIHGVLSVQDSGENICTSVVSSEQADNSVELNKEWLEKADERIQYIHPLWEGCSILYPQEGHKCNFNLNAWAIDNLSWLSILSSYILIIVATWSLLTFC